MDIYGVIGWPIEHSLSPAMHNAAFKKLGIDAEYRKFEVKPEDLEDFLLNRKDVKGFNITIPHKVRAREILERNFPIEVPSNKSDINNFKRWYYIETTGAVNTVKKIDNRLEYCNTDVEGFSESLQKDLRFNTGDGNKKDINVLLIGCGGAGRAVIAALTLDFTDTNIKKIYIYDKNKEAVSLAKKHFLKLPKKWMGNLNNATKFISKQEMPDIIKDCQLLVNASPVGMEEADPPVIDKSLLRRDLFVYDVIYNRETELVKDAKSLGLHAIGGKGMLKYQGAYAFEFWTGISDGRVLKTMGEVLDNALGKD